jgi:hypothetical protein
MNDLRSHPEEFANAFESAFARLQVRLEEACLEEGDWPRRTAAAIRAGLDFAAADPAAAQLLTNKALAREADAFDRYERLISYLSDGLAPGREQQPDGERLPDITEHAMASGVVSLIAQRVDRGREQELPGIAGEAIQFVLTPYLGSDEARRLGAEHPPPSGCADLG